MAQEYYTLEEAARFVNLPVEKLKEMAQKRQVRAFSDGGSWKFRKSDLAELARPAGADEADILADENVLLDESALSGGGSGSLDDEATVVGMSAMRRADESDIQLVVSDADTPPNAEEDVVPIGDEPDRAPSDSDIRLTLDEGMPAKSTEDLELIKADAEQTDYDIGALDSSPEMMADSDEMGTAVPSPSDSDMTMALESITLDEDEDIGLGGSGSGVGSGVGSGSGIDSGLNLEHPADSGISLEASDSSADSDFELSLEGGDDDLFKSDEVPGFKDVDEDELPAVAKKPAPAKARTETDELSNSDFELAIDEDLETEEESGSEVVAIPEDEEDEEVGDEFEEEDEYGEELPAAVGLPRSAGMMVAANPAWPAWMVIPCALTSIVLAVVGMMMYEVMRHAWSLQTEHTLVGNVVKAVADLFAGSS